MGELGVGGGALGMEEAWERGVSVSVSEEDEKASSSQESAMGSEGLALGLRDGLWEEGERERLPSDASTSAREGGLEAVVGDDWMRGLTLSFAGWGAHC